MDSSNIKVKTKYYLVGVCTHNGNSSYSGHYTACCLTDNNEYYYFSDTQVEKVEEEGQIYEGEPYILFYRRNDNNISMNSCN